MAVLPLLSKFLRLLCAAIALLFLAALGEPALRLAWYAARLAAQPAPSHLPSPVAGVPARALRDSWHAPRDGGGRRHEGMDILAPRGRPVLSATEGIVTGVGVDRLGGKVVWVMGPGGQRHYYAHLDSYADVRPGQRVAAGQVLAYVGDTGNARGGPTHLHYGIYTYSGPINPFPLLRPDQGPVRPARSEHSGRSRLSN
jgi:murein DD-endopeptidase MepM/ murein hydrolase activator NlpD